MHRTDAANFEANIGNGERGFKGTPPGNETTLASAFMNAVQEELCQVIEDAGLTVRASSGDDTAALWGQLSPAIQALVAQKGVIANAASYGMGPAETGADNLTALNAALAASRIIYIPSGSYTLTGAPTIPDGTVLLGDQSLTVLGDDVGAVWDLSGFNIYMEGLTFQQDNPASLQIQCNHSTTAAKTIFSRCGFTGGGVSTSIAFNTAVFDGLGDVIFNECLFSSVDSIAILDRCPNLAFNDCFFSNTNVRLNGATPSNSRKAFRNCRIGDASFGTNTIYGNGSNVTIEGCTLDGSNTFEMSGPNSWLIRNNTFVVNPTVTPSGIDVRYSFIDNKDGDGRSLDSENFLNGAKVTGEISGNIIIGNGASQNIIWNNNVDKRMAYHPNYTSDNVYDGGTGIFKAFGLGNSRTRIVGQVLLTQNSAADVFVTLKVNGTSVYVFTKSEANSSDNSVHALNIEVNSNVNDTYEIFIENLSGGNATVLQTSGSLKTFVVFEGL